MFYKKLYAFFLSLVLLFSFGITSCSKKSTETLKTGGPGKIETENKKPLKILEAVSNFNEQNRGDQTVEFVFNKALSPDLIRKLDTIISINKLEFKDKTKPDPREQKPSRKILIKTTNKVNDKRLTIIFPKKQTSKENEGTYEIIILELPDNSPVKYMLQITGGPFDQSISNWDVG